METTIEQNTVLIFIEKLEYKNKTRKCFYIPIFFGFGFCFHNEVIPL